MATRKKKQTRPAGELGESAQRIWLAGVGALASAEEEGSRVFEQLVSRGREVQTDLKSPIEDATDRLRETVAEVRGRAGKTWKRVETAFDQQVTAALHRLGVPTRREVEELTHRVESLRQAIDGVDRKPSAKKKTAKKTTKRKAAKTKKTGSKKTKTGPAKKKTTKKKVKRKS
jgi:poly(hydroxyalkanoate) granule-associated protein